MCISNIRKHNEELTINCVEETMNVTGDSSNLKVEELQYVHRSGDSKVNDLHDEYHYDHVILFVFYRRKQ